jgi:hypothetical protein
MIAKKAIPSVRRDGRVQLDRQDLDNWVELGKTVSKHEGHEKTR